tara:strand:- start:1042 stop:1875 length:834 start_codon:yes stop_codon:yes gene_type:complete
LYKNFFYKLKIFFLRILGYDKPLRLALLKYLSLKYKRFRPHYETILLESVLEAKKIGYTKVSIIELGVAGGNGIIALENYKKKIQKITNVEINICGFDFGEGLPDSDNKYDLPFFWISGLYKADNQKLNEKIKSKIYYGDIKDTFKEFIKTNPPIISTIFSDLDYYTSTKNFLNQLPEFKDFLTPRVYCYFDDIFNSNHYINEHNGELLAIKEFNNENEDIKIGKSVGHSSDFKFPLGGENLFMLHNFNHIDYFKNINFSKTSLSLDDKKVDKIFNF